jgi:hypothetical protein
MDFLLGWLPTTILAISTSQVARIIGMNPCALSYYDDENKTYNNRSNKF